MVNVPSKVPSIDAAQERSVYRSVCTCAVGERSCCKRAADRAVRSYRTADGSCPPPAARPLVIREREFASIHRAEEIRTIERGKRRPIEAQRCWRNERRRILSTRLDDLERQLKAGSRGQRVRWRWLRDRRKPLLRLVYRPARHPAESVGVVPVVAVGLHRSRRQQ